MSTSTGTTPTSAWRAARGPVVVLVVLAVAAVLLALASAVSPGRLLEPDSYAPGGGHALAVLLRDRGIHVEPVRELPELLRRAVGDPGTTTVFVPYPELEPPELPAVLRSLPGESVLVGPEPGLLDALGAPLGGGGPVPVVPRPPGCALDAATRAGRARTGGRSYILRGPDAVGCYPTGAGQWALVRLPRPRVTVVGDATAFTNGALADDGDAALALNVLGRGDSVLWLVPGSLPGAGASAARRSASSLLPGWVRRGALEGALALGLLALWRARRLGRVVTEPLPVVVRAAEAVEGRGRLYRAAAARGRAGAALRAGSVRRAVRRLGLPPGTGPETVVTALSERTGRPAEAVRSLLYGATPADDAALVRLAGDLDRLTREAAGP